MLVAAGLFVAAFLLGSIPFGLIISKVFYHTDLREHGSGNIGTTNAIRTMGKVGGYAVFVLDFGKGLLSSRTTPCWPWRSSAVCGAISSARGLASRAARGSRWPWAACS